ncbi:hypothetical protein A0H81_11420 [Grifola frondosa]|uniref:Uncharacterized protein n=1 Tax=Grifola frondosa TaxID=5627 RepID=A0A1C7LUQ6_GRIFR|nr:hypothetical protein A0H81_11420 [Grifola frondosa]
MDESNSNEAFSGDESLDNDSSEDMDGDMDEQEVPTQSRKPVQAILPMPVARVNTKVAKDESPAWAGQSGHLRRVFLMALSDEALYQTFIRVITRMPGDLETAMPDGATTLAWDWTFTYSVLVETWESDISSFKPENAILAALSIGLVLRDLKIAQFVVADPDDTSTDIPSHLYSTVHTFQDVQNLLEMCGRMTRSWITWEEYIEAQNPTETFIDQGVSIVKRNSAIAVRTAIAGPSGFNGKHSPKPAQIVSAIKPRRLTAGKPVGRIQQFYIDILAETETVHPQQAPLLLDDDHMSMADVDVEDQSRFNIDPNSIPKVKANMAFLPSISHHEPSPSDIGEPSPARRMVTRGTKRKLDEEHDARQNPMLDHGLRRQTRAATKAECPIPSVNNTRKPPKKAIGRKPVRKPAPRRAGKR